MQINTFTDDELLRYAGGHAATPLEQELTRRLEKLSDEYDTLVQDMIIKDQEMYALERKLERFED